MIKKILLLIIGLLTINIGFSNHYNWGDEIKDIYTQDKDNVINDNGLNDPLRDGTLSSARGLQGVAYIDTSSKKNRQQGFMDYITIWVNRILGLLSMIVIIFIIKDGIIIIGSAGGDENKKKEAFKNIRNYIIALLIIGSGYLVVNLVFSFMYDNTGHI